MLSVVDLKGLEDSSGTERHLLDREGNTYMYLIQEKAGEFILGGVFSYKERELQKIGQKKKKENS